MNRSATMLSQAQVYLAERRRLGFALNQAGRLTLAFARFADASGHEGSLTAAIVLRWAKEKALHAEPFTWAGRVAILKPFARYLADRDPATEFPEGSPFGRSHRRLAPHIYSMAEVEALVVAAGRLPSECGLAPATFTALFGLLAATGLRISEALRLRCGDLDDAQSQLTIWRAKFQRCRLVPLHPTVTRAVRVYLSVRARYGPWTSLRRSSCLRRLEMFFATARSGTCSFSSRPNSELSLAEAIGPFGSTTSGIASSVAASYSGRSRAPTSITP